MANIKISELNPLLTVEDADVLPIVDNAVTKKVTAAILRSYTQGNSVLLTGAQTVAGIKTFTSQLASTVATGTAPFSVASTTKVTNLNADLLDGLSSADFQATLSGTGIVKSTSGTISYLTDNSTNWNTAYNDKINSAAVTGSGTNTLTLTQQDAGTITATWVNGTLIREIRNNTGATLTKGTIVYISGATGNKPTVSKAIATGDSTSAQTFGFVQENILNNANGYVVVVGDLTGVDTSAFAEGDQLYLSATTAGTFTDVKQYAPNHLVYVGIVTRSHPTLGQIEVNIQNGYELDELHNVAAQSPSNGDILQYVTSTGLWTKIGGTTSAISEGSNLYFTNARSRTAISLTTTGTSGAATYNSTTGVLNVPNYADTDTGITSLNGLTALTQTFAVGTSGTDFGISSASSTHTFNLPTASAANRGALSSADWTTFNNKQNALTNPITGTGTTNYLPKFTGASALGNSIISDSGTTATIGGALTANGTLTVNEDGASTKVITIRSNWAGVDPAINVTTNNSLLLMTNNTEKMRIAAGGNVLIGTTTDAGYKLDVNGTARVSGAATFSSSVTTGADATINGVTVGKGAGNVISNTVLGVNALVNNTTGLKNVAIGVTSLFTNSIGQDNTSVGFQTLYYNTSGSNNSALGENALLLNTTGSNNTSIGYASLFNNNASNNTAVGFEAGYSNTSAIGFVAVGYQAMRSSVAGYGTAIGYQALRSQTTGEDNTAIGYVSSTAITTGQRNTSMGTGSLVAATTASNNTALGWASLNSNTANNNTAVGYESALSNTSGEAITAIGFQTLKSNTTGSYNSALGYGVLFANTTGSFNTATGLNSQYNNTTGGSNSSYGVGSLQNNVSGSNNTALGNNALSSNTASNNTAVGFEAGFSNTIGTDITAIGYQALRANTTGYQNTAVGYESMSANTTGYYNTAVGYNTQTGNFNGSVILGRSAVATGNNQFVVGTASVNAGAVATETNTSSKVWNVIINGVAQKILLA